ncbi:hypothetical protein MPTK1_7g01750 [Marchantia polymorpha subsp. ruderalis]|uniref:Uncharacterized protein n=2 Tax=Marchantia polymorpha TaxID=3197 RepID=A0AAF6BV50_MARPO|nr:hypothetical protein MARPO_0099s0048 [Marchantia polymorpha]BBN15884.1 hypothetical protein Mp_7g01750 [Marchantia polymorpha subsp. ruderalis]|eukprot:PTQ32412.1 hypothetical protein MARPO_0099s0048 [Marchantia polymorpha]
MTHSSRAQVGLQKCAMSTVTARTPLPLRSSPSQAVSSSREREIRSHNLGLVLEDRWGRARTGARWYVYAREQQSGTLMASVTVDVGPLYSEFFSI